MPKKQAVLLLISFFLISFPIAAQRSRIAGRIDNNRRVELAGHIHPQASAQFDQGLVEPSLALPNLTLMLQPSASQQADLEQLLAQQQDPASPNYHNWLTPEEYAARFGVSQSDIDQITQWLESQHLPVVSVARAHNAITIRGTAAQAQAAFGVELHYYLVNGERHFANATAPSIPQTLQGVVVAIRGLHDFHMKPASRLRPAQPGASGAQYTSSTSGAHYLAPDDIAAIYDIKPLFASGLDGSGQKLVVVGQTNIRLADIQQYRSYFNLPANDPQVLLVPGSADPGILACANGCDLIEADLDIELSGAVARNATIIYVYSTDVLVSAQYAIDQNLAPVLSMSYGSCEALNTNSDVATMQAMAQQANAEGITWFAASGDNGATDCAGTGGAAASSIVAVDMPASLPGVTGIGGTTLNDSGGTYWNASNDANNASAIGYIPEVAWNDSVAGAPSASGGGASVLFGKPDWQVGPGVPTDNARDVPDVAISASAGHDGYVIFSSDGCGSSRSTATCKEAIGGTSVGAPTLASLFTLLNQAVVSSGAQSAPGLGNINPKLYSLAQSAASAFHDVTAGNNIIDVTCTFRARRCTPGSYGFNAGPGYDLVTGLGSIDASALFTAWGAASSTTAGGGSSGGSDGSKSTGPVPVLTVSGNAFSYDQRYAPGMLLTIYGSQLSAGAQSASSLPLPLQLNGTSASVNNIAAPLYAVSAGQLNVQIPYEIPAGSTAVLKVTNNGQSASLSFPVAAAAPGIFTDASGSVPAGSAARGDILTLFVTGAGAVTPAMADGAAPLLSTPLASLPKPAQPLTVKVGGVTVPQSSLQFAGVPWGLVGIVQVNFQVPATAPVGAQPVVVNVGGVDSKAAMLTVR
jgi:uncharacterized protein (TIGR03437 family)